jgi:hypothetical protein
MGRVGIHFGICPAKLTKITHPPFFMARRMLLVLHK